MKLFLNYVEQLDADKQLLDAYREMRELFQHEGWSEKDLGNPPYYTAEIMSFFGRVQHERTKFINEIMAFFGDTVSRDEINDYILNKLNKINMETPLSDTDYPRKKDDTWEL